MSSPVRSLSGPGLAVTVVVALAACLAAVAAHAQSLRGGRSSMDRQNREARRHAFTFLDTSGDVYRFVEEGYLVPIPGNGDYELKPGLSFPYARPEVKLFLERLGRQYRAACGEPLVATSLTRPRSRQPRNASPRSVHPTGMAVDLRVSWNARCRRWIEGVFLSLEAEGVLDANREYHPPHYHVALFPEPYAEHVARLAAEDSDEGARATAAVARYTVRHGDNLWRIASRYGTSVEDLKAVNDIRSSRIQPGQVLAIPTAPR
jgi:hypothetical protein